MNKKYFILLWLLFFSSWASSINSNQWLTQNIQVEDGLPSPTVFSVQQDQNGFLWFGTVDGVARYDGYEFKLYQHNGMDLNSISNNNAGNIFIDSKNTLWIGTFGGGLNTIDLNTNKLTRHPYSNDKDDMVVSALVQTFHEDKNSNIWVGTPHGLYKYSDKVEKHYQHKKGDSNSLIHSRIWDIVDDPTGNIWAGTTQGLSKLNPLTDEITNFNLPIDLIEDISSNEFRKLFINDNQLWIGSSSGLFVFDLQTHQFESHPLKYNIKVNDLKLIGDKILVATMGGMYQFDLTTNSFLRDEKGELWRTLSNIDLRKILVDRSGLLWLATRDTGVIKIDRTGGLFTNQSKINAGSKTNELSQKVWTIDFDNEGNTFLGTSDTLIKKSADNEFTRITTKNQGQIPGRIRTLKRAQNQDLWIGSSDGLFYLDHGHTVAREIREPFDLLGIKPADIFSIEVTQSGEVWLSLSNLGILRWHPIEKKAELLQEFQDMLLTDLNINKIIQDSEQNMWITTSLVGLIKFDTINNKMTLFSYDYTGENSISSNRVTDVYEDRFGRLWIGTARGLNLYNPETNLFKVLKKNDGLLDESVYSILEDSKSNIWVSHSFGVSRINQGFDQVQNFKINTTIRKDGLNIGAANINKSDEMYFGSINGLYTFNPQNLLTCVQNQPNLLLTQVNINNLPLTPFEMAKHDNHFELSHLDKLIFFNFSALEFNTPDSIKYSYRVSGLNENWHDVTSTRQIELNSLKAGEYSLEIKATNSDCRWSEQKLSISIHVHPVWWNLWWVRGLFVITALFIAFLMHYFRSGIIRKRNIDLERTVANRTSELMLLNQKLESASQTDFLTGLYNRTGFLKKFNSIQTSSQSHIVLADIDHFKRINDLYGHLAGDKVLKEITKIMRSFIKVQDFVARWGGEEFIFYFENETADEIFQVIEQIRTEIQANTITYADNDIQVTCTFGICQIKADMKLNDCIKSADESMYKGKSEGRNTTVVSPLDDL